MTKRRKFLILSLFTCLSLSGLFRVESRAEEASGEQTRQVSGLKDENPSRLESVTGMDENGNIFEVEDSGGVVEDSGISSYARAALTPKVVNFRTKGNAVTEYKEVSTGIAGYTNGAYGADAAYLGTSGGKVMFMLSGVVGQVDAGQVQVVDFSKAQVVSCYKVVDGRLRHYIAQDITTPGHATSLDNGPAPSYLGAGTTYYSYDGHYFYTSYSVMLEDYQNNSRSQSVNSGSPYYNYFQYLPMRSKTGYDAGGMNNLINSKVTASSKMRDAGSQFVNHQDTYGVNSLLMAGIAANESAWGTSSICQNKNNIFGLNAVDSSPGTSANTYASVDECIRQFANGWMSRGYLNPSDWRYKGGFLGNKASGLNVSYASDPYWGEKAANIVWNLDKTGGSQDAGKYTIGIKDTVSTSHTSVNVRNEASASSTVLYKTGTHSSYAVLLLDAQAAGSHYRMQSDAVLNEARTAAVSGVGEYNFDNMFSYIASNYVTVVNQGSSVPAPKTLSSIYISAPPAKTAYTEGEVFDASGMAVMARWSDGTESDVTSAVTYPAEPLAKGTGSVTIQYLYEGISQSATQQITVSEKAVVTEVAVNPAAVQMKPGESRTFGVAVTGTGNPSKAVTWSVEGAASAQTTVDANGKLQIGADETAETLTVKAVSVADNTKMAAAVVTLVFDKVDGPDAEVPADPDAETPDGNTPDGDNPDISNPGTENPGGQNPDTPNPENPGDEKPGGDAQEPDVPDDGQTPVTDVKDEATGIWVSGKLPEGTGLTVSRIDENAENYAELTEPVKTHTILGVYDIALSQKLEENETVQLGFKVDPVYNGQNVVVLHYTESEGKLFKETYKAVVENGAIVLEVGGFSPYVIALEDAGANPGDGNAGTVDPPAGDEPSIEPEPPTGDEPNVEPEPPADNREPEEPSDPSDGNPPAEGQDPAVPGDGEETPIVDPSDEQPQDVKTPVVKSVAGDKDPANVKRAAKTGDVNHAAGWGMLLVVSMLLLLVAEYRKIRNI